MQSSLIILSRILNTNVLQVRPFKPTKPRNGGDAESAIVTACSLITSINYYSLLIPAFRSGYYLGLAAGVAITFGFGVMLAVANNPATVLTESEQFEFVRDFGQLQGILEIFRDNLSTFLGILSTSDISTESTSNLINLRDELVNLSQAYELGVSEPFSEFAIRLQNAYHENLLFNQHLNLRDSFIEEGNDLRSAIEIIDAELTWRNPGHISVVFSWIRR